MQFDDLMKSFARQYDLGALDYQDGQYHLVLDGHIEAACFQANGRFYVQGRLATLPENRMRQETMLTHLLQQSLSLLKHQRVSLCLEPDRQDQLVLYLVRPLIGLGEREIEQALTEFANNVAFYAQHLQDHKLSSPSPALPVMIRP